MGAWGWDRGGAKVRGRGRVWVGPVGGGVASIEAPHSPH